MEYNPIMDFPHKKLQKMKKNDKKLAKYLAVSKKYRTFALAFE